jgi:hypothetical protein
MTVNVEEGSILKQEIEKMIRICSGNGGLKKLISHLNDWRHPSQETGLGNSHTLRGGDCSFRRH